MPGKHDDTPPLLKAISDVLGGDVAARLLPALNALEGEPPETRTGFLVHGRWHLRPQNGALSLLGNRLQVRLGEVPPEEVAVTLGEGRLLLRAGERHRTVSVPPAGLPFRRVVPRQLRQALGILRLPCDRLGGVHVGSDTWHLGPEQARHWVIGVVMANRWHFWALSGEALVPSSQTLVAERKRRRHSATADLELKVFRADRHAQAAADWLVQRWIEQGAPGVETGIIIQGVFPEAQLRPNGSLRVVALRPDGSRLTHIGLSGPGRGGDCIVEFQGPWVSAYTVDGGLVGRRKLPHPFGLESAHLVGYPGDRLHRLALCSHGLERVQTWWLSAGMYRYRCDLPPALFTPKPSAAAVLTEMRPQDDPRFTLILVSERGVIQSPLEPVERSIEQGRLVDAATLEGGFSLVLPVALRENLLVTVSVSVFKRVVRDLEPLAQAAGLWTEWADRRVGDALVDISAALVHLLVWRLRRWHRPQADLKHVVRARHLLHQISALGQSLASLRDALLPDRPRGPAGLLRFRSGALMVPAELTPGEREEAFAFLGRHGLSMRSVETMRDGLTCELPDLSPSDQALLLAVTQTPVSVTRA